MTLTAASFLLFPRFFLGLYTHDAAILRYGTGLLLMAGLFQLFDGAQVTGISLLRGAADTRVPMLITLLGYWGIGIPVAYWLGFHTELRHVGIWAGLTLSLAVVALLLLWRVRLVLWRRPVVAVVVRPAGLTQRRGDTERAAEPLGVSVALREADL
jgi:MATE family multidrug resistance protein